CGRRLSIPQAILAPAGSPPTFGERYGAEAHFVSDLIHANPALETPIIAGLPYTEAEVIYAIRHELAGSVDDILSRRLRARLMARDASATAATASANSYSRNSTWPRQSLRSKLPPTGPPLNMKNPSLWGAQNDQ
ncbi:hypothetical protein UA70_27810, partial [Raoultella planticola]